MEQDVRNVQQEIIPPVLVRVNSVQKVNILLSQVPLVVYHVDVVDRPLLTQQVVSYVQEDNSQMEVIAKHVPQVHIHHPLDHVHVSLVVLDQSLFQMDQDVNFVILEKRVLVDHAKFVLQTHIVAIQERLNAVLVVAVIKEMVHLVFLVLLVSSQLKIVHVKPALLEHIHLMMGHAFVLLVVQAQAQMEQHASFAQLDNTLLETEDANPVLMVNIPQRMELLHV